MDPIDESTQTLIKIANDHPLCRLILNIRGIGAINATAIYSVIGNGSQFSNDVASLRCGSAYAPTS
jgi:hypothetical protein